MIPGPPPGLRVTGFRDPYVIQNGGKASQGRHLHCTYHMLTYQTMLQGACVVCPKWSLLSAGPGLAAAAGQRHPRRGWRAPAVPLPGPVLGSAHLRGAICTLHSVLPAVIVVNAYLLYCLLARVLGRGLIALQGGSTWARCVWASRCQARSTTPAPCGSAPSLCPCPQTPARVRQAPWQLAETLQYSFTMPSLQRHTLCTIFQISRPCRQDMSRQCVLSGAPAAQAVSAQQSRERTTSCACHPTRTSTSRPPTPACTGSGPTQMASSTCSAPKVRLRHLQDELPSAPPAMHSAPCS